MRVALQENLDTVQATLLEECELVLRSLRGALNGLREADAELADEVIAFDDEVDALYMDIEQAIEGLLARQTPVAVDLRLALAMLHTNLHLERMADYCVTIAKLTTLVAENESSSEILAVFEEMGTRAEEMIRVAVDSFVARDAEQASTLPALDQLINRGNRRLIRQVIDQRGDRELLEWALRMVMVSRCLERIGDHAVDIGEQTAYLVTGEFREFTDASRRGES